MPAWSSPSPSSRAEQSMPSLSMPRIGFGSIDPPVGHRGAGRGERHDVAGRHVERAAPHVALAPSPASTYTRCTLAASGWRSVRTHPGGDDTVDGRADVVDLLDGEAESRSCVVGDRVDVVAERRTSR